jgi:DtxR family transcriptional regulator, Mn-dependent transcriptional regulator
MTAPLLSTSVEDYLKAVFVLSRSGGIATTTDIASRLAISAPSVSGMLRRLADQGLVDHVPYRGVALTATGRDAALRVIRRHRIIETYLVERLGLGWDEVHVEAERLEHAVSDRVLERMAQALGHPEFDPHGDPIPAADGSVPVRHVRPLTQVAVGEQVRVQQVLAHDGEELRYLARVGLVPGAAISVSAQEPVAGTVHIASASGQHVVGHALADRLLCTDTSARDRTSDNPHASSANEAAHG